MTANTDVKGAICLSHSCRAVFSSLPYPFFSQPWRPAMLAAASLCFFLASFQFSRRTVREDAITSSGC